MLNGTSHGTAEQKTRQLRYLACDSETEPGFLQTALVFAPERKLFTAKHGIYQSLQNNEAIPCSQNQDSLVFEAAALAARYGYGTKLTEQVLGKTARTSTKLSPIFHRDLLLLVLTGRYPKKGLTFLKDCGFLSAYWPELQAITETTHSKDYHPEGDLWQHTMETFSHRKSNDFILSLALLLHDIGKPDADSEHGRRFHAHAEIGSRIAVRFLERLEFEPGIIRQIEFLIANHMLPYGLPTLPFSRVEKQLKSPLFPLLLELFRCDELSTWKGPELYYEACARYKEWCKASKNPYRTIEGAKIRKNSRKDTR